jgi:hypothetical protein
VLGFDFAFFTVVKRPVLALLPIFRLAMVRHSFLSKSPIQYLVSDIGFMPPKRRRINRKLFRSFWCRMWGMDARWIPAPLFVAVQEGELEANLPVESHLRLCEAVSDFELGASGAGPFLGNRIRSGGDPSGRRGRGLPGA